MKAFSSNVLFMKASHFSTYQTITLGLYELLKNDLMQKPLKFKTCPGRLLNVICTFNLEVCNFIKKETLTKAFSCEICETF